MWRGGREPAGRRAEAARCPGGGPAAGRRAKAEQLFEGRRRRRRRRTGWALRGRVSGERILAPGGLAAWQPGSGAADHGPSRRGVGLGRTGPPGESCGAPAASLWPVQRSHRGPGALHVGSGGEGEGAAAGASLGGRGAGLWEV